MATTFLDLPDDLILEIAELLYLRDRRVMRLLTKRIDQLISPILFETLCSLEPALSVPEPYALLSENLSRGKELVFSRCTKKMVISASGDYPFDRELPWLRLLNNLVPTLSNLRSLEWSYWPYNHPVSHLVIDALNSFGPLPNLRELIVTVTIIDPFPSFNLKSFSNLFSVSINWQHTSSVNQDFISDVADLLGRCPGLEHFTFSIPRPYHPSEAPLLAHILAGLPSNTRLKLRLLDVTGLRVSADDFCVHLHHLLSLKVLRLMFNRHADPPEQNSQICQLLLDNSIHLDELTIDTTHPTSVLDYLSSYSGLQYLKFKSRYPGADTPEGVSHFFSSVLPPHSATLRELSLGWSAESLWTREIAQGNLAQIEKCQQLRRLSCYVTVTAGPTGRTDRVLRIWLETAMKLPRLQYLVLFTTRQHEPPLRQGKFYFDYETRHEFKMENAIKGFAQAAMNKFTANLLVPFQIRIGSPTVGP